MITVKLLKRDLNNHDLNELEPTRRRAHISLRIILYVLAAHTVVKGKRKGFPKTFHQLLIKINPCHAFILNCDILDASEQRDAEVTSNAENGNKKNKQF